MKLANVELLAENLIGWDAILKILMMSKNYLPLYKKNLFRDKMDKIREKWSL